MNPLINASERSNQDSTHAMRCLEVWGGNQAVQIVVTVPGIDAWVSSRPFAGDANGGDVHSISTCGAGRISRFAVADVSGHGSAVGEMGGRLRRLMRKHIRTPDQTVFARAINDEFEKLSHQGEFATALLTTYFAPTAHFIVCNLGQPRPLWYRSATKTWTWLDQDVPRVASQVRNLPLGIIAGTGYVQFAARLGERDLVVIYTDALTEARSSDGTLLDELGLLDLVRQLPIGPPADLGRSILAAVTAYRGGCPANDDETILVLHHNASNPPRHSLGEKLRVMARMLGLGLGGDETASADLT